ncbi:DNA (cytosine-5-)-methyltransferase [Microseira sp. BLCC-F43]
MFELPYGAPAVEPPSAPATTVIELFAGAGGLALGLETAGLGAKALIEIDKDAVATLRHNRLEWNVIHGDVSKVSFEGMSADIVTGGFPCFVSGTHVLTDSGYKEIESVDFEDLLFTHTGTFRPIVNIQRKNFSGNLYRLKVIYLGEEITCTPEHPFFAIERKRVWNNSVRRYEFILSNPAWVNTDQLTQHHYVGIKVNEESVLPCFSFLLKQNSDTAIEVSPDFGDKNVWFLMGYFLGDGWIEDTLKPDGRPTYKIRFAVADKNREVVLGKLQAVLPLTSKQCRTGTSEKFGCSSAMWYHLLKSFGKYAQGKKIPEWVQNAPKEYIEEFLDGFIAADGCTNSITSVSYNVIAGLQRLFLKLGKSPHIIISHQPGEKIIEGRLVKTKKTYMLRGFNSGNHAVIFKDGYAWFKIKRVNLLPVENQEVFNFEVADDNSYCVQQVVVHNCQSFSYAGKGLGFEDTRGTLFYEFARCIKEVQPKLFLAENVKGLISHEKGKTLKTVLSVLESLGYNIQYRLLNAVNYDVPQKRERVIIVGTRPGIRFQYPAPSPKILTLRDALKDVPPSEGMKYSPKRLAVLALVPPGGCWRDLPEEIQKSYMMKSYYLTGGRTGMARRISWDEPSLTLTTSPSQKQTERCHPDETRPFTVREYARIQTFPDDWEFIGGMGSKYKQIGNAVPVSFAYHLGRAIVNALLST